MASNSLALFPLIVIVGPTASGKSRAAIEIALEIGGEIICADSRTIYKYMDIGTAKAGQDEQEGIPHWGLDLIEPGERYSAADFKEYAQDKISDIRTRNKYPILVGGTGLYVDGIIFNYEFGSRADITYREKLEKMSIQELYKYCLKNNIILPQNSTNKRYVVRAIENRGSEQKRSLTPIKNTIIVGITTDKDVLKKRIHDRVEQLFNLGVVEEAKSLGKKYGWGSEAMKGNIYRVLHDYLEGKINIDDAKAKNRILDWRLAKRQLTWLKRNDFISWMLLNDVKKYVLDRIIK